LHIRFKMPATVLVPCDDAPHPGLSLGRETLALVLQSVDAWVARLTCRAFRAHCAKAARNPAASAVSSVPRLRLAVALGFDVRWAARAAAVLGQTKVLEYVMERRLAIVGSSDIERAIRRGHSHVLEWALHKAYVPTFRACTAAAAGGHLQILKRLRHVGCAWDRTTCSEAAAGGHLDLLRWAVSQGCEWDATTALAAADGGHLELLQWALTRGCGWSPSVFSRAARAGHLVILQWAVAARHEWSPAVYQEAAAGGHMHILEWAWAARYPGLTHHACTAAASAGRLDVLRWAHARGAGLGDGALEIAAVYDHLEIVQWLCDHGCSIDRFACMCGPRVDAWFDTRADY